MQRGEERHYGLNPICSSWNCGDVLLSIVIYFFLLLFVALKIKNKISHPHYLSAVECFLRSHGPYKMTWRATFGPHALSLTRYICGAVVSVLPGTVQSKCGFRGGTEPCTPGW